MKAIVVDRPGNAPLSEEDRAQLKIISSLDEINLGLSKESQGAKEENPENDEAEPVLEPEVDKDHTMDEDKPAKVTPKRKRQSKESGPSPKSLRRSKRLSGE